MALMTRTKTTPTIAETTGGMKMCGHRGAWRR